MEKRNEILELSFEFAVDIIAFSELLEAQRKYVLARQILKSGTSIGANIREAQNGESKADFVHKLKIAAKEADEMPMRISSHQPKMNMWVFHVAFKKQIIYT
jgi:four helix bundle protein